MTASADDSRRPQGESPIDWGGPRPAQSRPAPTGGAARAVDPDLDWGSGRPRDSSHPTAGPPPADWTGAPTQAPDAQSPRGWTAPGPATDWGVRRDRAPAGPALGRRSRTPWPAAVWRQRLGGVVFALAGLALATWSAMNLARAADAGHPWVPPWLLAVLGGAGLVSAAGYLAWAGGTPVKGEERRWTPTALDAAAGLTTGVVEVVDPHHLLDADTSGRLLTAGTPGQGALGDSPGDRRGPGDGQGGYAVVDSGPTPIMGTSTLDQSLHAPAGVAGAVGGFMLAAAVVCAVIALVLGTVWLLATGVLALGGIIAIRLAGDWLGAM